MKFSIESLTSSNDAVNNNSDHDYVSDHLNHIRLRMFLSSHQGGRKYMEDEYCIVHYQSPPPDVFSNDDHHLQMRKSFVFLGIFDGHGGNMAARYTCQNLYRNIIRQKNFWSNDDDKVCLAIHKGFVRTQKAMMNEVGKWPKTSLGLPSTSGTTASVLFIMNGKYYTGHVGDSRIVMGRKVKYSNRWFVCPMTQDHKPEFPKERKRIEATGGQVVNKSGIVRVVWNRPRIDYVNNSISETAFDTIPFLSVARSLGDLWSLNKRLNKFIVSPEPDVKSIPIDSSDKCLILASDGLWNMVNLKQAMKVIQDFYENEDSSYDDSDASNEMFDIKAMKYHSPSLKLLNVCLNRWLNTKTRADNTTVLIVMLDHISKQKKQNHDNGLIDKYDFDLNVSNNFTDNDSMIGDTIHTFHFDRIQTDENFVENSKTNDEKEIEIILNEILDRFCSNTDLSSNEDPDEEPPTLTTNDNQQNELIDEEKLSSLFLSTYSSASRTIEMNNTLITSLSNNCSPNNFNCCFSIFDYNHNEQNFINNNHQQDDDDNDSNSTDPDKFGLISNDGETNDKKNSTLPNNSNNHYNFSMFPENFSLSKYVEDYLYSNNSNSNYAINFGTSSNLQKDEPVDFSSKIPTNFSFGLNNSLDDKDKDKSSSSEDSQNNSMDNEKNLSSDGCSNLIKKRKFDLTNFLSQMSSNQISSTKRQCLDQEKSDDDLQCKNDNKNELSMNANKFLNDDNSVSTMAIFNSFASTQPTMNNQQQYDFMSSADGQQDQFNDDNNDEDKTNHHQTSNTCSAIVGCSSQHHLTELINHHQALTTKE